MLRCVACIPLCNNKSVIISGEAGFNLASAILPSSSSSMPTRQGLSFPPPLMEKLVGIKYIETHCCTHKFRTLYDHYALSAEGYQFTKRANMDSQVRRFLMLRHAGTQPKSLIAFKSHNSYTKCRFRDIEPGRAFGAYLEQIYQQLISWRKGRHY